ncbi:MAG: S8 family serine peptidase [Caldilineaceae bacterium]
MHNPDLPQRPRSIRWRMARTLTFCLLIAALVLPAAPMQAQDGGHSIYIPLVTGSAASMTATTAQDGPALKLKVGAFHPSQGDALVSAADLSIADYAPGQRGYYIVQFNAPVQKAWQDALAGTGAQVLDYLPDYAFKVRMNPEQAAQVRKLANVAWVGIFQPAYKLSPDLARNGAHPYRVYIEQGADSAQAAAAIAQSGAEVLRSEGNYLLVAADDAQLNAVANVLDVAWVENFTFYEKHNEYGAGVIIGADTANANGYDGSSQIAAVADTGLGDGTPAGAHPGLAGRVLNIFNWTTGNAFNCYRVYGDGAQDADSGHGTHVAVSVAGAGNAQGIGKAAANAAGLVFQAVEDYLDIYGSCTSSTTPDGYYLIGIPSDLHQLFQQAYNAGARIHSNSWGSNAAGDYTQDSANADDFVWDNPDMVITFSAGNEGADANNNGVVDNDSIGSPATAKNVITVGASENVRPDNFPCDTSLSYASHDVYQPNQTCNDMGGHNLLGTAGQRWGFTTEPLNSDLTAGNAEQMAPFSSRGPTDDGRIKPDVVAPGTWILSGYSSLFQEGYNDPVNPRNGSYQVDGWGMPYNAEYKYFGGTSMSNPIAAGAATVVRDFYNKKYGHNASAALTKATLINSAVDLQDENNDGVNDNDYPIPNVHEGWGRINLAKATEGTAQFEDVTSGIGTGGSATYQYNVASAGAPFKVSLVWSDYASTAAAAVNLVNDLDLVVTAPNGTTVYRGNVFSGGWSQTGGSADRVNNVENVYVQSAAAGTWTVRVSGFNAPQGPQPFALVVNGQFSGGSPTATPTNTSVPPTATNTPVPPTATPTNTPVPPTATPTNTPVGPTATNTPIPPTATPTNTPVPPTATSTPSALTVHVGDLDNVSTTSGNRWNARVQITVHDGAHNPVTNASVSASWSSGTSGSGSCTTNGSGQCIINKNRLRNNVTSVQLTINSVTLAGYTYSAGNNHDPESDSNGTAIIVAHP